MRIRDLCTSDTICVFEDLSVREAAREMRRHHVGMLVVMKRADGNRAPVGVLTDRDVAISIVAAGVDADALTVGDAMTRTPATCEADDDAFAAVDIMLEHGVRRLPVLDRTGALVGVVAADDLVGALGDCLARLSHALVREQAREMSARR